MKLFKIVKTIQLIIFFIIAGLGLMVIFTNEELYHLIGTNVHVKLLCGILWAVMGLSFLFLLIDFSQYASIKQEYYALSRALHSDPVSGIANRYSCDVLIEKYENKPLPSNIGCIMFELTNITETNRLYGHDCGNRLIRNFSNILKRTSVDLCFVGRNGGNKFLAIFEEGSQEKIETLLSRIEQKITTYNANEQNEPAQYSFGIASNEQENVQSLTELIALANSRIPRNQ